MDLGGTPPWPGALRGVIIGQIRVPLILDYGRPWTVSNTAVQLYTHLAYGTEVAASLKYIVDLVTLQNHVLLWFKNHVAFIFVADPFGMPAFSPSGASPAELDQQIQKVDRELLDLQVSQNLLFIIWATSCKKVPNVLPESLSYQKKDGRAWPHPPFLRYDTDFLDFFLNCFFIYLYIFFFSPPVRKHGAYARCTHTRPSLGMTPAHAIRDLFA